jgi:chaperonin GroEL (HSP60 family)
LNEIAVKVDPSDKEMLKKIATISMATKLISENSDAMSDIAVEAMLQVAEKTSEGYKADVEDVKVEKKAGESMTETRLIQGVVLDKEVVHSGMPKRVEDAKIALLNCALEVEKTEFDAKINIQNPEEMKAFLDEEEKMLRDMAEKVGKSGANVLITQKGIDDVVQHFLAKKNIMAVRRASEKDMEKLARASGAKTVTNIDDLRAEDLGYAKLVEERKIADDKMTFIEGCKNAKAVAILIRGGTQRFVDEAERSLHDALCVVRDVIRDPRIVAGGGAVEIEVAGQLKRWAEKLSGKEQLAVLAFADALEAIPLVLAENAGLDPLDILVELRASHEKGQKWVGVDPFEGKTLDMMKANVIEPAAVKEQILKSASEAASMLLKIDDIVASGKSREGAGPPTPPGGEAPDLD